MGYAVTISELLAVCFATVTSLVDEANSCPSFIVTHFSVMIASRYACQVA